MTPAPSKKNNNYVSSDAKISSTTPIPTFGSLISVLIIIFLIYAFFSGLSYQFYASFLFLFYGVTNSMWISVMMLGIFQTMLMVPFRMIRIVKSNNIQEFQQTIVKIKDEEQQGFILKKKFKQGNPTFLFYAVDFVMQLVSYISLGRLFLTDFYSKHINPEALYSWVPKFEYPIQDTFFKIPYPAVTGDTDFGWRVVLPVWVVLIVVQILILIARRSIRKKQGAETEKEMFSNKWSRYTTGYLLVFMILAWLLVRNFPTSWDLRIFTGDISIPNRTFNTVTAVATFLILVYHGIPKIYRKTKLAEKLGLSRKVIEKTQMRMFKDTFTTATLVGLGAFFITNRIPSSFELSIFTLEVISLAAPFTIDKVVLKGMAKPVVVEKTKKKTEDETKEDETDEK